MEMSGTLRHFCTAYNLLSREARSFKKTVKLTRQRMAGTHLYKRSHTRSLARSLSLSLRVSLSLSFSLSLSLSHSTPTDTHNAHSNTHTYT